MYKLKLEFELENNIIENTINIAFASFLKQSLEKYNVNLYEEMFLDKKKKIKKYCYSLQMKPIKREKGKIFLQDNYFSVELTSMDLQELFSFYNAFLSRIKDNEKFSLNQNSMKLKSVTLLPYSPKIATRVIVKTQSPIVVRSYSDSGERYLSVEDSDFEDVLNKTVERFLDSISMNEKKVHISVINAKKTVMGLYRFKANATLGIFEITGDIEAIAVLSLAGLGSNRGAGAGKFKILG